MFEKGFREFEAEGVITSFQAGVGEFYRWAAGSKLYCTGFYLSESVSVMMPHVRLHHEITHTGPIPPNKHPAETSQSRGPIGRRLSDDLWRFACALAAQTVACNDQLAGGGHDLARLDFRR